MKAKRKSLFSILLLLNFLTVFAFNAYRSGLLYGSGATKINTKGVIVSGSRGIDLAQDTFICEETENDLEAGSELPVFFTPLFNFLPQSASVNTRHISTGPLAKNQDNPIYISVRNFRI